MPEGEQLQRLRGEWNQQSHERTHNCKFTMFVLVPSPLTKVKLSRRIRFYCWEQPSSECEPQLFPSALRFMSPLPPLGEQARSLRHLPIQPTKPASTPLPQRHSHTCWGKTDRWHEKTVASRSAKLRGTKGEECTRTHPCTHMHTHEKRMQIFARTLRYKRKSASCGPHVSGSKSEYSTCSSAYI